MNSPSLEEFVEKTKEKYISTMKKAIPILALLEITNACNMDCPHCGLESGKPLDDELTTKEIINAIDQLWELGTKCLLIMGGEPTVRRDLLDIIKYASNAGMYVSIGSNGILITPEYAASLKEAGLHSVKLSLDSHVEEFNDADRGPGSYKATLAAIEACKGAGLDISVGAMISNKNYEQLPEIVDFVTKDLGVAFEMGEFFAFGRGAEQKELVLDNQKRKEMQRYLLAKKKELGASMVLFEDKYIISEDLETQKAYAIYNMIRGCKAGTFGIVLTANGKVLPCPHLRIEVGDVRQNSLKDIWENSELLKSLRDRNNLKGKCGSCEYTFVCGGCRSSAYVYSGDIFAQDPMCWYTPKSNLK